MLNLLIILEVDEYLSSIGREYVFHKEKASKKIETKAKTSFLIGRRVYLVVILLISLQFADSMAPGGRRHFVPFVSHNIRQLYEEIPKGKSL